MQGPIRGTLITWKQDKRFGFIRPDGGGTDVFVHNRDFGSILVPFWMSVLVNCACLAGASTDPGASAIRDLLY